MQVVLTGGSGKLGRACLSDLLDHGYSVTNVDLVRPADDPCPFVRADLTDMGQTLEVLHQVDDRHNGVDAVVHLGAVPAPGWVTGAELFRNNTVSTYNVFAAARHLGIRNVVWASSETVLGLPFNTPPPYVPVDEEYPPRPESTYALSKTVGEEMARQFCRWEPEMKIVGLRFSNVMLPADYAEFPAFDADPVRRKWNLWSYIDARDAAQAVRKAIEAPLKGAEVFIIASPDTVMSRPTTELVEEFFPGITWRREVGPNQSAFSIGKARRLLGYEPQHTWRSEVAPAGG
ncbi:MAG TPA: NAD(P)-dependent oxidoreductase [Streptosporangiaceae bacterium]|jgi:nucleoside-diphosphate-sugar epimerase|nr:NAD(P)-dependent oxidoreductase [Streptosporangiaceae bacterium]